MEKVKTFFIPCHSEDAHLSLRPDCRSFPHGARIFVELPLAIQSMLEDPFLMDSPNILIVTVPAEVANRLAFENKLVSWQFGEWNVLRSAQDAFMASAVQVRMMFEPHITPPSGKRSVVYALLRNKNPQYSHISWAAALRVCYGETNYCNQSEVVAELFPDRKSAMENLRDTSADEDPNVALIAMWVLEEKAEYALKILRRCTSGYKPGFDHMQVLIKNSVCQLELFSVTPAAKVEYAPPPRTNAAANSSLNIPPPSINVPVM